MLNFFDADLLIPDVVTVVYLGTDIFEEGDEFYYFEDFQQHSDLKKNSAAYTEQQIIRADQELHNFYTDAQVAQIFALLAEVKLG